VKRKTYALLVAALALLAAAATGTAFAVGAVGGGDSDQEPAVILTEPTPAEAFAQKFKEQLSVTAGKPNGIEAGRVGITSRVRGANPDGARLARNSPNGGGIFVLPADEGVCIASDSGVEEGCYEEATVSASSVICAPGLPGDQVEVFGVAPDGIDKLTVVLADGSERTIAVERNVFVYRASKEAPRPLEVAWTTAAGERRAVPAHVPEDFRDGRCANPADPTP